MNPALSLYLDALRLIAALVVLLSHLGHGHLVGGPLWRFTRVGNEAVMVFFVLSGFVIAFVADRKEHSLYDYAASRLSRLYSVVVPALLLTLVLDTLGSALGTPRGSQATPHDSLHGGAVGYVLSLSMLSQSWGLRAFPGSNQAYWSVPYEFWYYALFGAWTFLTGAARWLALSAAALMAGPQVVALLPVWLCGVAAYRWLRSRTGQTRLVGRARIVAALSGAGVLALFVLAALQSPGMSDPPWFSGSWPWQLVFGGLAGCHLAAFATCRLPVSALQSRWAGAVRFCAGCSFSLYLFHLPVLKLLESFRGSLGDAAFRWLLIAAPLLLAGTLGHWCERQKSGFKVALLGAVARRRLT